jgi:hypothetical protein
MAHPEFNLQQQDPQPRTVQWPKLTGNQDQDEGKQEPSKILLGFEEQNNGGTNGLEQKQRTETGSQAQAGKSLGLSLDSAEPKYKNWK